MLWSISVVDDPENKKASRLRLDNIDLEAGEKEKFTDSSDVKQLTADDFVCIDVGGSRFVTRKHTLERFPTTLLGDKQRRDKYYVHCRKSLFFDHSRKAFEAIFYYYQSGGILIRPPDIPMEMFSEEIEFFDLGKEVLSNLKSEEGYLEQIQPVPDTLWQRKIWELFEFPDSSICARFVSTWSILVIVVSITLFCMETLPHFHHKQYERKQNVTDVADVQDQRYAQPWFSMELSCIVWFTFEFLMRFISSPNKCKFMKCFSNIIDLMAILPYFITMSIESGKTTPLPILRVVRLVRVFRVFKLSRYSTGLRILGHTLKASLSELGMLIFFLMIGVILFSTAIFYAEQDHADTMFTSIPSAFWYTLVTMTTVGYGDMVPKTFVGKIFGSLCALTGVLTIALPVPVIASNFMFFYKRDSKQRRDNPPVSESNPGSPEKKLLEV